MSIRLNSGIDINQIKHTWKGDWNTSDIYYLNDVVKYHGQSFVCVTTVLSNENLYGRIYQPTVANEYWRPFSNGYLIKGTWSYKQYYYPGDVVSFNSDWYLCKIYNFGVHPIYENGSLTTKWTLITSSSRSNKSDNHIWFAGYNPIGWTRNYHETPDQFWTQDIHGFTTINGNYEATYIGRGAGGYGFGSGPGSIPDSFKQQTNAGYDFWDYYDGYRTSITGGFPKCIQVVGGWSHKLFLFDNGEVYSFGYGGYGQNGDGTDDIYGFARRVGRSTGGRGTGILKDVFVVKVAAPGGTSHSVGNIYEHCAAIDSNGNLWMWGYNGYGGLGNGTNTNLNNPTQINRKFFDNANIVDVWCTGTGSYQSTYALDSNNQLWGFGYSGYGILGAGDIIDATASLVITARPNKVALDFTNFGGIKKFIPSGHGSARSCMVQTNDDQLWFWGYSSFAAGWGYGAAATVITKPRRLKELIFESASSLGKNKTAMNGDLIDVVTNCDEFWYDGRTGVESVLLKEKNTGLMYGMGRQINDSMPFNRSSLINYSHSDKWSYSDNVNNPVLMQIGNFNDVKSVHTHGSYVTSDGAIVIDARGYLFLNRDGRMFTTGSSSADSSQGVGVNFRSTGISNAINLPWEYDATAGVDAIQVRWSDSIDMVIGYWDYGWAAITKNNKFIFCGQGSANYSLIPSSLAAISHTPTRLLT